MDDYLTRAGAGPSGFDAPPILIAGDSDDAMRRYFADAGTPVVV